MGLVAAWAFAWGMIGWLAWWQEVVKHRGTMQKMAEEQMAVIDKAKEAVLAVVEREGAPMPVAAQQQAMVIPTPEEVEEAWRGLAGVTPDWSDPYWPDKDPTANENRTVWKMPGEGIAGIEGIGDMTGENIEVPE